MTGLVITASVFCLLILVWNNPMPVGTDGFWLIAKRRILTVGVILVAALCHGVATVTFQTITSNRILTPSIIGFEALYRLMHTSVAFFFGLGAIAKAVTLGEYLLQVTLMVAMAMLLYGWLLVWRRTSIHQMLLVGLILASAMTGLTAFMQRMLSPTAFDVLLARLIGSIANADVEMLGFAAPIAMVAAGAIFFLARTLNVMALGRPVAIGLGVNYERMTLVFLGLISVLMAVTTSLIGPISFLGFLTAMITYQVAQTHDHRQLLPMVWLVSVVTLAGAYFTLRHLVYAQGSVGIIIEMVGGIFFLTYLLRKGRL
ncbi:MAG: iron chelate uptake ABC transporter family permease subunit [Actinomycetaceae bacterium]|nr:iron chelate uptake ABC transporter family permease subunit [Actinomycetaceae bacterium]